MKIYTRFGDDGKTALFDGTRVAKDDLRIATYGTLDELNSILGVAIAHCNHAPLADLLKTLQHQLFDLGADLATPLNSPNSAKVKRIGEAHVTYLEKQIDAATDQIAPLRVFILPGGGLTASHLHVARTVARRAERHLVTLMAHEDVGTQALIYVNRLSDLLFTLARLANKFDGINDVEWEKDKTH